MDTTIFVITSFNSCLFRSTSGVRSRSMRARLRAGPMTDRSDSLADLAEELQCQTDERAFQYEEFMKVGLGESENSHREKGEMGGPIMREEY